MSKRRNSAAAGRGWRIAGLFAAACIVAPALGWSDNIASVSDTNFWGQTWAFWTFGPAPVRHAALASVFLGLTCGLLGSYLVVRKLSLVGDTVGHAVLPGVCIGFLISGSKGSPWVLAGATGAGLLGTYMLGAIHRTTRIKPDTAMALILSSFFAIGICLVTYIQGLSIGNKAGLDKILFGQIAGVGPAELKVMAGASLAVLALILVLHKEWVASSFDEQFAASVGLPTNALHHLLMLLLAVTVVIAIQAVGVVLVCAMLITPAATAYLLCDRMRAMLVVAAVTGMLAGLIGAYISFLDTNLPTGPFMVVAAAVLFGAAYLFAPRHGVVSQWWRRRLTRTRTELENTLKAVYHVRERGGFLEEGVAVGDLAEALGESAIETNRRARRLVAAHMADLGADRLQLTREGTVRACEVVRNHRLWELYLVAEAKMAADHVHDDAEKIEHVLGEDIVQRLEEKLQFPRYDPHGKPIPSLRDLELGDYVTSRKPRAPHEVLLGRYRGTEGIPQ